MPRSAPYVMRLSRILRADPVEVVLMLAGPQLLDSWPAVTWAGDGVGAARLQFKPSAVPRPWRSHPPTCVLLVQPPERTPVAHRIRFELVGDSAPVDGVRVEGSLMVSRVGAGGPTDSASRAELVLSVSGFEAVARAWLRAVAEGLLDTLGSLATQRVA